MCMVCINIHIGEYAFAFFNRTDIDASAVALIRAKTNLNIKVVLCTIIGIVDSYVYDVICFYKTW